MPEQAASTPKSDDNLRHLPAILPPAALVLQRTESSLGLLREVVRESSEEYWFDLGKMANEFGQWDEAIHCYLKSVSIKETRLNHTGLYVAYQNRSITRMLLGDEEGAEDDELAVIKWRNLEYYYMGNDEDLSHLFRHIDC